MTARVFDMPDLTVVNGVACTWCGVGVTDECRDLHFGGRETLPGRPHAQRWRDYWNATHDRAERVAVYPNPKRKATR